MSPQGGSGGGAVSTSGAANGGSGGAASGGAAGVPAGKITVKAGAFDRHRCIVPFAFAGAATTIWELRDDQGTSLPLQVSSDGTATFILPELLAGQELSYIIEAAPMPPAPGASSAQGASDVTLKVGDANVLRFQAQGELPTGVAAVYLRGGYIHPLYSPAGVIVTGDYPASHVHHHGIWSAWTRSQFNGHAIDFWNMADGQGKVDFEALGQLWHGPVHSGFEAELAHIDLLGAEPVTALSEHWRVTAYKTHEATAPYFTFDLASVQKAATAMPVQLDEYIYGGFGIRGAGEWLDKAKVNFLTSEGFDRATGDSTTGRWVYIGGSVGGSVAGFAVLGHPENFRAPQPLRIHPDEPYASVSPPKTGPFSIEPGADYVTRFRIITLDGAPDANLIDALWNDYATPPEVSVD